MKWPRPTYYNCCYRAVYLLFVVKSRPKYQVWKKIIIADIGYIAQLILDELSASRLCEFNTALSAVWKVGHRQVAYCYRAAARWTRKLQCQRWELQTEKCRASPASAQYSERWVFYCTATAGWVSCREGTRTLVSQFPIASAWNRLETGKEWPDRAGCCSTTQKLVAGVWQEKRRSVVHTLPSVERKFLPTYTFAIARKIDSCLTYSRIRIELEYAASMREKVFYSYL